MTPRTIRRLVLLGLSTLAAWDAGATAQASPLYTITDLGTLPGKTSSVATGINDSGQIVGQGMINGQEHAFLMTPDANQVPEPDALTLWGLVAAALCARCFGRWRRSKD